MHADGLRCAAPAEPEQHARIAGRRSSCRRSEPASPRDATADDSTRACRASRRYRVSIDANAEPVTSTTDLVQQHPRRSAVVEDDDIDSAVVVEIASGHAARDLQLRRTRGPALSVTSVNFRPTVVAKDLAALLQRIRIAGLQPDGSACLTAPLATTRSSQPSLS